MNGKRAISAHGRGNRCGHHWCSECRTKRGRNRGNRNVRHAIRAFLRKSTEGDEA